MSGQTLTALIHGDSGVGKSWLADSVPAPRLILDAEGRSRYLPSEPKVYWDPWNEPPPPAGDWQTCIAQVIDFRTMDRVKQWLQSGEHCFKSVAVDSLMEVQKRLIDDAAPMKALEQRDWGTVLRELEKLVRDYRDLVAVSSNPVECVVFTAGSKEGTNGKMRPMLQGQMRETVPYFVDVVGYLYTDYSAENPAEVRRALLVSPGHPVAVAKDNTNRLPRPIVSNPNLSQIFETLNGNSGVAVAPAVPSELETTSAQGEQLNDH